MARLIAGIVIGAVIAGAVGWYWMSKEEALLQKQDQQISVLNDQVSRMDKENQQLKTEVAKLQEEETHLAADNDALNKAIAQSKATGKPPVKLVLPYPPSSRPRLFVGAGSRATVALEFLHVSQRTQIRHSIEIDRTAEMVGLVLDHARMKVARHNVERFRIAPQRGNS